MQFVLTALMRRLLLPLVLVSSAYAAEPEPLPEPLTLDYALSLADEMHPTLLAQEARRELTRAQMMQVEADNALSVSIEGRARWVEPSSIAEDEGVTDDHKLSLFVRKPLYDFGLNNSKREAARQSEMGAAQRYRMALRERKVAIMQAFFDVLLADMQYARDNEELAITYIALDKLRNRQEMGQASDIQVFELESEYQRVRTRINRSRNLQRATRSRLANLLNRPGMLPSDLQRPSLDYHKRELPEYEELLEAALEYNPQIKALESELDAARRQVEAARAIAGPRVDGEVEASAYSRELGSSDRVRAGVTLEIPIYTGGRVDAAVAEQQANVYELQSRLAESRYALRQNVLDLWLELQNLKLQREQAYSEMDYRELYLDRSRTDYELEFEADLGDAMVRMSEAQLALAKNNYEYAIVWERLLALTNHELPGDEAASSAPGTDGEEKGAVK
ncbi:MAG: TolC family protein [Pseudomonadota bacterium]